MARIVLFRRGRCWLPTAGGWAVLALACAFCTFFLGRRANSFLSVSKPVPADLLIVESWLPDRAMVGAVAEFNRGNYKCLLVSSPCFSEGWMASRFRSPDEFAAANLAALGMDTNAVVAVPCGRVSRDRTYAAALAIRRWLEGRNWTMGPGTTGPQTTGPQTTGPQTTGPRDHGTTGLGTTNGGPVVRAVNLYSFGAHARRSRLLYQKALGRKIQVGVIAYPDYHYDPARWWAEGEGFRDVVGEGIAYLYARLLFHPG